jgi:hypothetical protein
MMPKCRRGKHRNGDPETPNTKHLENESSTLCLLVTTKLEVLASLQRQLELGLALDTLQSKDNLLGGLGLLVEDGLGLTTVTGLLAVISTLTLGEQGGLSSLVLGDLVLGVLAALLALAVGVTGLGNVDHFDDDVRCRSLGVFGDASSKD